MRKLSLVLAAAAVVLALAVSGSAWAGSIEVKDSAFKVKLMLEGEIIHKSAHEAGFHYFTIIYEDKSYFCTVTSQLICNEHT